MQVVLVILFCLTALGGIYLASYVFSNRETPKGVAIAHGSLGAISILFFVVLAFFYSLPLAALAIFILAAMGGIYIFLKDIKGVPPSKLMVLGHGLLALCGVLILILWIVKQ
ncbi:hypothetical protein B1207_05500 [Legionella quinlivanii]|uniref:Transmembrane protein n=1 Tax=Legionella quinlivanii TaxID=45073 RepID=A0A364LLS0_9GAMM|nr:hypothetical protein [Legionella quinlivanii]RAP37626.1 hypothetical protein B1207_05500 [Legionella quinlivanii]